MVNAGSLKGLHCLVLGAGGFIGGALASALCDCGAVVQGFGRIADERMRDSRVVWTNAPFSDSATLARALEDQDIVFHLLSASVPESSNREPAEELLANVYPTVRMLDLCRNGRVRKVIFSSSGGTVYGIPHVIPTPEHAATEPISAYGIGKIAVERYLALYHHLFGLDYHVLRLANPYGPGQSPFRKQGVVAATLYHAITHAPFEIWGTGDVTRDFVHIRDVCNAFVASIEYTGPHRVMNVGSGEGRSINGIIADIEQIVGIRDFEVVRKQGRIADVPVSVLDTTLIRAELGWLPNVAWDAGLVETANWTQGLVNAETPTRLRP